MKQPNILKQKTDFQTLIRAPEKKDIALSVLTLICQRASILGFNPFGCVTARLTDYGCINT